LDIPKDKNAKNIDNIINKKRIHKREKSYNDSGSNDENDDNSDDRDDYKIKPKFKEYKIDYNELNQTAIGKNAITFLKKNNKKLLRNIYLSLLEMINFIFIKIFMKEIILVFFFLIFPKMKREL
jgi:hypothetical protein